METENNTMSPMPKGRKPCQHGKRLPRGLVCDSGYLYIRIWVKGRRYKKAHGPHTPALEKAATIVLNRIVEKRYFNSFEFPDHVARKNFAEVADLYYQHSWEAVPSRTEANKYNCRIRLIQFKTVFGEKWFDEITGADILKWRQRRERSVSFSTVNKDQRILSSIFNTAKRLIETKMIESFRLPKDNPCKFVKNPSEEALSRNRVPLKEEMAKAKAWCFEHDRTLWDIIELAASTGRRKGELMKLKVGAPIQGIQGKTGKRYTLPITLEVEPNWVNFDERWEKLRRHMGWFDKTLQDGSPNPQHTVLHDLKHFAPTVLAEKGFTNAMIQAFTQHSDPKMANRYTNPRDLGPAVKAVRSEINDI